MALRKNQKTLRNYPEQGPSNLTFEAFRRRFSKFLEAHDLDTKVKTGSMVTFFEIVQEHMQEKASRETARKAIVLRDHGDCEKLIKGIRNRLKQLVDYLEHAKKAKSSLTSSLARSSIKKLTQKRPPKPTSEPTLEDLLTSQEVILRSQRAMLSMIKDAVKNADRELTIDLLNIIAVEFPGCTEKERDVLIGATFAGAGLYDENTLGDDSGPVERVPMKVSRAKKRIEDLYSVPGSERNNPAVIGRRKKQRLLRQNDEKAPVVQPVEEKPK